MGKNKTGGGKGTNQYQVRGKCCIMPVVPNAGSLAEQAASPLRRRCGEVWGSNCRTMVTGPDWSHFNHPSPRRRFTLAGDPDCAPAIIKLLSVDENTAIRSAVAANPGADDEVLARLSQDPLKLIRARVAGNPSTDPDVLDRLSVDWEHMWTRKRVADHPNTRPETLARLLVDPEPEVREAARQNPNLPEHLRVLSSTLGYLSR